MSSALITRKGKPEKLSCPALANQQFEQSDESHQQGNVPERVQVPESKKYVVVLCIYL
ncbi:MAG: hypothetical protein P1V19_24840 [Gimesia sp.]|nr:hypothetical protein [Gimesia sp.]